MFSNVTDNTCSWNCVYLKLGQLEEENGGKFRIVWS